MSAADLGMAVSLSVGELPKDEYERLYRAGTRRYLLRIETSNPDLYATLHPSEMSWEKRVQCLRDLKEVRGRVGGGRVGEGAESGNIHTLETSIDLCLLFPSAPLSAPSSFIVPQVGMMIGTGVMVGLPGQTLKDLAGDILFFKVDGGKRNKGEKMKNVWTHSCKSTSFASRTLAPT